MSSDTISRDVIVVGPSGAGKTLLSKSIKNLLEEGELLGSRLDGLLPDTGQNIYDINIKLKKKFLFKRIPNYNNFILQYCKEIEKRKKSHQIIKLIQNIRQENDQNNEDSDEILEYFHHEFTLKDISSLLLPSWNLILDRSSAVIFVFSLYPRSGWSQFYELFSELWLLLIQKAKINQIKPLLIFINKVELYDEELKNEALQFLGIHSLKNNTHGIPVSLIEGSLLHSKNVVEVTEDISYDTTLTICKWILLSMN